MSDISQHPLAKIGSTSRSPSSAPPMGGAEDGRSGGAARHLEEKDIAKCPHCDNWCTEGEDYRPFGYCQHDIQPSPKKPFSFGNPFWEVEFYRVLRNVFLTSKTR